MCCRYLLSLVRNFMYIYAFWQKRNCFHIESILKMSCALLGMICYSLYHGSFKSTHCPPYHHLNPTVVLWKLFNLPILEHFAHFLKNFNLKRRSLLILLCILLSSLDSVHHVMRRINLYCLVFDFSVPFPPPIRVVHPPSICKGCFLSLIK